MLNNGSSLPGHAHSGLSSLPEPLPSAHPQGELSPVPAEPARGGTRNSPGPLARRSSLGLQCVFNFLSLDPWTPALGPQRPGALVHPAAGLHAPHHLTIVFVTRFKPNTTDSARIHSTVEETTVGWRPPNTGPCRLLGALAQGSAGFTGSGTNGAGGGVWTGIEAGSHLHLLLYSVRTNQPG